MSGGPLAEFENRIAAGQLRRDPAQGAAVLALQALYDRLLAHKPAETGFFSGLFAKPAPEPPKGLYMYGGVGRGKSMLMDLFFDLAPVDRKRRVHFHAFMQEIHDGMGEARTTGARDPVQVVADRVMADAQLLCFDELQITDIADAMIVGRLFDKLFAGGVVIVTTSNRHPDDLYKDGLNRKLFLPFIDLVKARLALHLLDSDTDHRQKALDGQARYLAPLGGPTAMAMDWFWDELAGGDGAPLTLRNKGRVITLARVSNGVARVRFEDLCAAALGPSDYLLIMERVTVLMMDDIPILSRARNNEAKRFVTLIDTIYEAGKPFICTAEAMPEALYVDGAGAFEFERTASRLIEMGFGGWPPRATGD